MIQIIQRRKTFYWISGAVIAIGLLATAILGVRLGIDFTGGSLLEIRYTETRPEADSINTSLAGLEIESVQIQAVDEDGYLIRLPHMTDEQRQEIIAELRGSIGDDGTASGSLSENTLSLNENSQVVNSQFGDIEVGLNFESEGEENAEANQPASTEQNRLIEERFETIGPVIGQELASKSIQAIFVVLIAILIYIAWAFRKVSWPVQSWKYGLVALVTLFHDVLFVFGFYTILTHLYGWELNTAFVAAILTILGYSVNDTIVVFDRIRENVPRKSGNFEEIVNLSVNQTLSRSLITSATTLFVLLAVLFVGGTSIQSFVAALTIGVVIGTYSSIFIASPLLVTVRDLGKK
jgi:preprotein translocase subunit SecF